MMSKKTPPRFRQDLNGNYDTFSKYLGTKNEFGLSSTYRNCKVFMEGIGIKKYKIPSMKNLVYKFCKLSAIEKKL